MFSDKFRNIYLSKKNFFSFCLAIIANLAKQKCKKISFNNKDKNLIFSIYNVYLTLICLYLILEHKIKFV